MKLHMRTFFFLYLLLTLCLGCAESQPQISLQGDFNEATLIHPVRVEVYMCEASLDRDCNSLLNQSFPQQELEKSLVFDSLTEFETDGFANIQIDHIPASKKMLLLIIATDPTSNVVIGNSCVDNLEVENNSIRDVHLVLNSALRFGNSK